jgi:hypothetical protein
MRVVTYMSPAQATGGVLGVVALVLAGVFVQSHVLAAALFVCALGAAGYLNFAVGCVVFVVDDDADYSAEYLLTNSSAAGVSVRVFACTLDTAFSMRGYATEDQEGVLHEFGRLVETKCVPRQLPDM